MSRFEFRFGSLLKLRQHQEEAARLDLAEAHRKVLHARNQLDSVLIRRSAAAHEITAHIKAPSLTALQAGYAHLQHLARLEDTFRAKVAALTAEHEERREAAIEAQRARQIMENLRDRLRNAYVQQERRSEAQELDETAATQAARRIIAERSHNKGG